MIHWSPNAAWLRWTCTGRREIVARLMVEPESGLAGELIYAVSVGDASKDVRKLSRAQRDGVVAGRNGPRIRSPEP